MYSKIFVIMIFHNNCTFQFTIETHKIEMPYKHTNSQKKKTLTYRQP